VKILTVHAYTDFDANTEDVRDVHEAVSNTCILHERDVLEDVEMKDTSQEMLDSYEPSDVADATESEHDLEVPTEPSDT
jgi:hypothetical protein